MVKPFVKWAGGKTQLLNEINKKYPLCLGKDINKYCEPFVGGGAVLFDLLSNYSIEEILINDINRELINVYLQIKNNVQQLIEELSLFQHEFWELDIEDRKEYYYSKRYEFNHLISNDKKDSDLRKASLFVFLNRTCFNGLYRVNSKGEFNVPMGSYKKPLICDRNNLLAVNKILKGVKIICGDYSQCNDFIDENTFVYIDPPYRPLNVTSSFNSYSNNNFDDNEQVRLGKFVDIISKKGATILISNSDPKNVDKTDYFFDELYSEYKIERINARRMINSKANKRGKIKELLISN